MIGAPIFVELREGYPFDGINVQVPRPGPSFAAHNLMAGAISVLHVDRDDFTGSGFGHKVLVDDRQYYTWQGKEIPRTTFEIAVTVENLTEEETTHLVTKTSSLASRKPTDRTDWNVLFSSDDPQVWNTDSPDPRRFAISLRRVSAEIRYLRLMRLDTREYMIIPITYANLARAPGKIGDEGYFWNGTATSAFRATHLGIGESRAPRNPPSKPTAWNEEQHQGPPPS